MIRGGKYLKLDISSDNQSVTSTFLNPWSNYLKHIFCFSLHRVLIIWKGGEITQWLPLLAVILVLHVNCATTDMIMSWKFGLLRSKRESMIVLVSLLGSNEHKQMRLLHKLFINLQTRHDIVMLTLKYSTEHSFVTFVFTPYIYMYIYDSTSHFHVTCSKDFL